MNNDFQAAMERDDEFKALHTGAKNDLASARSEFVNNATEFLKLMREKHTATLAKEDASESEKAAARSIIGSIDLIEDPEPVVAHVAGVKRILSTGLVPHDKARSFFRRHQINQLKYPELVALLKNVKDPEHREKLTGMFNAIVVYAMEHADPKSLTFFVKYGFMLVRSAAVIGLVPTLSAKVYEQAKRV